LLEPIDEVCCHSWSGVVGRSPVNSIFQLSPFIISTPRKEEEEAVKCLNKRKEAGCTI
jgi:hypothetical protein